MRTLYLLRHAKSSWDDGDLRDHDRPLAPRGTRAARLIADHMRRTGVAPAVLLCSSARRTVETLELLGDAVPAGCDVRISEDLYGASSDELLGHVRALPGTAETAMLIGHNPGVQRLALTLSGQGDLRDELQRKMPTAALATLVSADDAWSAMDVGGATLTAFVRPRDLPPGS